MKRIFTLLMTVIISTTVYAQMKKPSIIVIPSKQWMKAGGHTMQFNNQGMTENVPNYRSALESDPTLNQVLVKLSGVIRNRGFEVSMLEPMLDNLDKKMAAINMDQDGIVQSSEDILASTAKADLIVDLSYTINQRGPQKSVQFTLYAKDAGTGSLAGQVTGNTEPSSGSIPEEMSAALNLYMDNFQNDLMKYFEDIVNNGRSIRIDINTTDNFDEDLYSDSYGDDDLMTLIEDYVWENTVGNNYNLQDATGTSMVFTGTKIPLEFTDKKGRVKKLDAFNFGKNLARYLKDLGLSGTKAKTISLSAVKVNIANY